MNLYRFSPIKSHQQLMEALEYVHTSCRQLCQENYGEMLPVAGNIGIFCHYPEEYSTLTEIRKQLTDQSLNFNNKYFKLHQPITFSAKDGIPEATYTYLYIRHADPYRSQVGDLDFFLEHDQYQSLKEDLRSKPTPGLRIYPLPEPDMVELFDPDSDVLAYISDEKVSDIVEKGPSQTAFALRKIDSIMFRVNDLDGASRFYSEVLGLKQVWRDDDYHMVGFVFPESDSEIVIHNDPDTPNPDFSFLVDNVEQFVKTMKEKGCKILRQPFEVRPGKYAVLADLDGNAINIIDLTKFDNEPKYD